MNELNKIYNMDCLEGMKQMEDNSVDLIVTDPPYQLASMTKQRTDPIAVEGNDGKGNPYCRVQAKKGFMGKEWDVLPTTDILKQCLRVLKDGAFSFWLMTPRQDSQMEFLNRLKEAGFVISFTPLYWTYASGFPKASNIGKMVDKKMGVEREVTGKDKHFGQAGHSIGIGGQEWDKTDKPATPQAKELDGSYGGFQPKPAVEVIIVAMKPLSEKTYVNQALKNKKGITWLGDVRVPYEQNEEVIPFQYKKRSTNVYGETERKDIPEEREINSKGRFPANLLVSDDVLNDGSISKSSDAIRHNNQSLHSGKGIYGKYNDVDTFGYSDSGSFSRYFDIDKWFIKSLPESVQKTFPFLIVPKASSGEKNENLDEFEEKKPKALHFNEDSSFEGRRTNDTMHRNIHPTVKPTKLMNYLITLGSREGDIILDPFIGSGTTAISCRILSRKFIGFERDKEYHKIAEARIKEYMIQLKLLEAI